MLPFYSKLVKGFPISQCKIWSPLYGMTTMSSLVVLLYTRYTLASGFFVLIVNFAWNFLIYISCPIASFEGLLKYLLSEFLSVQFKLQTLYTSPTLYCPITLFSSTVYIIDFSILFPPPPDCNISGVKEIFSYFLCCIHRIIPDT